uniref:Retinitis pigmentosa GTPase regulator b n=1 Tax=Esox lucius TaxID=8010 RepID=A0A6Q2ZFD9_ESOLU
MYIVSIQPSAVHIHINILFRDYEEVTALLVEGYLRAVFTFGKCKFADNIPSKFWLKNDHPEEISCGGNHTSVITGHGKLFMFGSNTLGQLGLGTKINININQPTPCVKSEKVKFAACGKDHTIICTWSGHVYGTGSNQKGQLGLGHCDDTNTFHLLRPFSHHTPIKMLACGCNTSAALTGKCDNRHSRLFWRDWRPTRSGS